MTSALGVFKMNGPSILTFSISGMEDLISQQDALWSFLLTPWMADEPDLLH